MEDDVITATIESPPHTDNETLDVVGSPDNLEIHEELAAVSYSAAADPPSSSSPETVVLTDDLKAKIIRQVEYYFSDENLPTDKFLMKYVNKDKDGFVPVAVLATFRKMKKLVHNDKSLVVAALRDSSQLVLSSSGKKVRRIHPLPITEVRDGKLCTVLVENLPDDCSKENLQKIFGDVGKIKSISIRDPHSTDDSAKVGKAEIAISGKIHALVEYETVNEAEKAVATLNDDKSWRNGIRVELLLKRMGKYGLSKKGVNEQHVKNHDHHDEVVTEHDETSHSLNDKAGRNRSRGGRGRGQGQSQSHGHGQTQGHGQGQFRGGKQHYANGHGHGHGSAPTSARMEGPSKPPPGPKMPDGTRGFTIGRGQPIVIPPDHGHE